MNIKFKLTLSTINKNDICFTFRDLDDKECKLESFVFISPKKVYEFFKENFKSEIIKDKIK